MSPCPLLPPLSHIAKNCRENKIRTSRIRFVVKSRTASLCAQFILYGIEGDCLPFLSDQFEYFNILQHMVDGDWASAECSGARTFQGKNIIFYISFFILLSGYHLYRKFF